MTRRLSRLVLAPILASLFAGVAAAADRPPNIVLIVSDDHGWTDYGFMGNKENKTPNLDRLAAESLTFRRGFVPSSLCCPSLASLVTGRFPQQHKITCNDPPMPAGMKPGQFQQSAAFKDGREIMNRHLESVPTLPRELARRGYVSLQTGKWWQGDYRRGGFTDGMTRGGRHGDVGLDIGRKTMKPISDFVAKAKADGKPYLVWYAPMMPHSPHTPPERLLAKYRADGKSIHVARYQAMVEWFDETIGELLKIVDDENTIVAYLADNGWTQSTTDGSSVRSKLTPYDAGLRTPIMIRYPGKIKPRFEETPISSVDLAPTLLKLAGVTEDLGMSGVNLLDEAAVKARDTIPGACFTHNAVDLNNPSRNVLFRWITDGTWKLIVPADPAKAPELYRTIDDPKETKEIASAHPDEVKRLRARLDAWWTPAAK